MEELELSLMDYVGRSPEAEMRPLLDQFEKQRRCRVRVNIMSWDTAREEFTKAAIYGKGPDVSEIGTTWCSNLISMAALRPFSPSEIAALGGPSAFLPSAWQSTKLPGSERISAIPWMANLRVLYYRRDLLAKAGIDEKTAFQSDAQLKQTLERLHASGVPVPLALVTRTVFPTSLHSLASWVWGAGGDFIAPDGSRTLLTDPKTRAGMRAYFELGQSLSPEARALDPMQCETLFWQGQAAVALSFEQPLVGFLKKVAAPQVLANLGVVPIPGGTFVGGSNLVVWRHIPFSHENLAMELVRFLASRQVQTVFHSKIGFFPVFPDMLNTSPYSTEPFHQILVEGFKSGRSFPTNAQWSIIEDRLLRTMAQIWDDIRADPKRDLDTILAAQLDPLAQRLDLLLEPA